MFFTRLISGIGLLIVAILAFYIGNLPLIILSALISVIGLFEFYRALGLDKKNIAYLGYAYSLIYYCLIYFKLNQYIFFSVIAFLLVIFAIYVFTFPKYKTEEISLIFMGVMYIPILFSYVYNTRTFDDGHYLAWLILISSWGSDTCAYAVGSLFGKHKIAPVLSPKKSVEGSIGGVLGAALIGGIFGAILSGHFISTLSPVFTCAASCAIGSVISQVGDALASAIKRNHNIKDYGNLIPGHGGILDRFDSMIFTAPAIFFAIYFLG
ncbi:phosphatidate cytidylyltransferase [Lachnoanaerobaculum gingivalis]|uniref:Phosphatidate cytidylyltransferase n=1 Tax=Lachnoanaerobaculum gingivalis TaxID=2490855 RepID=A0A3P3QZF2_9FIRM|nr:phosphatidate cytidylyltransferase [Lachnoanaerobaculum gingivalis]RRJ25949.1 phosphatidate cytidylyltransferase [Lachnoanaerobaculum gingivalis]WHE88525.1 phosphatidate cytidylyltransferase [Lachnoanaerobaculum gingivalis]